MVVVWTGRLGTSGPTSSTSTGRRSRPPASGRIPPGIPVSAIPQFQVGARRGHGGGSTSSPGRTSGRGLAMTSTALAYQRGQCWMRPAAPLVGTGSANVSIRGSRGLAYAAPNFMAAYTRSQALSRLRITAATGAVVDDAVLAPCCIGGAAIAYDLDTFTVLYLGSNLDRRHWLPGEGDPHQRRRRGHRPRRLGRPDRRAVLLPRAGRGRKHGQVPGDLLALRLDAGGDLRPRAHARADAGPIRRGRDEHGRANVIGAWSDRDVHDDGVERGAAGRKRLHRDGHPARHHHRRVMDLRRGRRRHLHGERRAGASPTS